MDAENRPSIRIKCSECNRELEIDGIDVEMEEGDIVISVLECASCTAEADQALIR